MTLRLPLVTPDSQSGGPIVAGMRGINALTAGNLDNRIKEIKAKYAPLLNQAQAASQMAYASLVGPQYIAKLFGNENILASVPEDQKNKILKMITQAGTNQSTVANQLSFPNVNQAQPSSVAGLLMNKLFNSFGQGQQGQGQQQPQLPGNNALTAGQTTLSPQDQQAINNMRPGDSYVVQGNQPVTNQSSAPSAPVASPPPVSAPTRTFAENAGEFAGVKAQGRELGTLRAKAIDDIGKQYTQDVESMVPINHLMDISQSPLFMNMRNSIPGFQKLQLDTLKTFGTPEQQRMIGDFITSAKSAVANTVRGFQGRAMAKEFDFANQLKIGDNDNINVILGKLESLATYKQATMQRDRIATNLMTEKHMNQGDAYALANAQVDMDGIRNKISSQLQSPIRIKNKKTGETKYISPKEYNDLINQK
jgi:hypothetical protein